MNELISRQAALAEIDKNRDALLSSGMTGAEHILVHYGRRVIEELPTIDVPDRKVGKWEHHIGIGNVALLKCDVCGFIYPELLGMMLFKFCPNCGHPMEVEE